MITNFQELESKILEILPGATIEEGLNDQLIIFTNLKIDPEGDGLELIKFNSDED